MPCKAMALKLSVLTEVKSKAAFPRMYPEELRCECGWWAGLRDVAVNVVKKRSARDCGTHSSRFLLDYHHQPVESTEGCFRFTKNRRN